jgi:hypothetical protein
MGHELNRRVRRERAAAKDSVFMNCFEGVGVARFTAKCGHEKVFSGSRVGP